MNEDLDDQSEYFSGADENLDGDDLDNNADPGINVVSDDRNSVGNQQVFIV